MLYFYCIPEACSATSHVYNCILCNYIGDRCLPLYHIMYLSSCWMTHLFFLLHNPLQFHLFLYKIPRKSSVPWIWMVVTGIDHMLNSISSFLTRNITVHACFELLYSSSRLNSDFVKTPFFLIIYDFILHVKSSKNFTYCLIPNKVVFRNFFPLFLHNFKLEVIFSTIL